MQVFRMVAPAKESIETSVTMRTKPTVRTCYEVSSCSDSLKAQTLDTCCTITLPARPIYGGGGVIVHEKIEEPVDKLLPGCR